MNTKTSKLLSLRKDEPTQFRTESTGALKVKSILVPLDFSTPEKNALGYAKALAKLTDATIYLLHVIEPLLYADNPYIQCDNQIINKEVTRVIKDLQHGLFKDLPTKPILRNGLPFSQIVAVAEDYDADLIVMSTHGYTGLKHILLGSTAEQVVRHARCPVLTIRP